MNITVLRCLHDFGDVVHVNYTVDRITQDRVPPIAVDVFPRGQRHQAFRCVGGSILNSTGDVILQVDFKPGCKDPIVTISKAATVNLSLEVEVRFTDIDMLCNTITIGPQSEYSSCIMLPFDAAIPTCPKLKRRRSECVGGG